MKIEKNTEDNVKDDIYLYLGNIDELVIFFDQIKTRKMITESCDGVSGVIPKIILRDDPYEYEVDIKFRKLESFLSK